jgi:hypothetical protein
VLRLPDLVVKIKRRRRIKVRDKGRGCSLADFSYEKELKKLREESFGK